MYGWKKIGCYLGLVLGAGLFCLSCNGAGDEVRKDDQVDKTPGPVKPPPPAYGPKIEVSYSILAETLHMAERISLWQRGMKRTMFREFDDRFGLDDADRGQLKKFAFVRHGLWEKDFTRRAKPTFAKPFGPQGMFPSREGGLQDRFWPAVIKAGEPAAVRRGLTGIVDPSDAEAVSSALSGLAARVGELVSEFGGYGEQASALQQSLRSGQVPKLLDSLGRFCGVDSRKMSLQVYLTWMPEGSPVSASSYGDVLVIELPAGEEVGPTQVSQVVSHAVRCMLARMEDRTKALATGRFVEMSGYGGPPFTLTTAIEDAGGYGLAGPLAAASAGEVPSWPGDAVRQRAAEAMTAFLRGWLAKGKRLDGVFALKAAKVLNKANPPRPSDFVDGAMVFAHDGVLKPFKEKVTRWMVWKYPITGKYNYSGKLDYSPGRSVLMVLTPKDLTEIQGRFPTKPRIVRALKKAAATLKKSKGVIMALPRESRGYIFVMASSGPEAMQRVAKAFFDLEKIPSGLVPVE